MKTKRKSHSTELSYNTDSNYKFIILVTNYIHTLSVNWLTAIIFIILFFIINRINNINNNTVTEEVHVIYRLTFHQYELIINIFTSMEKMLPFWKGYQPTLPGSAHSHKLYMFIFPDVLARLECDIINVVSIIVYNLFLSLKLETQFFSYAFILCIVRFRMYWTEYNFRGLYFINMGIFFSNQNHLVNLKITDLILRPSLIIS